METKNLNLQPQQIEVLGELVSCFIKQVFFTKHHYASLASIVSGYRYYTLAEDTVSSIIISKQEEDEEKPGRLKNTETIGVFPLEAALKDYLETFENFSKDPNFGAFVHKGKLLGFEYFDTKKNAEG